MKKLILVFAIVFSVGIFAAIAMAHMGLDMTTTLGAGGATVTGPVTPSATIFLFKDTGGIAFVDTGGIAFKDY
jgi:hypothetical protein